MTLTVSDNDSVYDDDDEDDNSENDNCSSVQQLAQTRKCRIMMTRMIIVVILILALSHASLRDNGNDDVEHSTNLAVDKGQNYSFCSVSIFVRDLRQIIASECQCYMNGETQGDNDDNDDNDSS